LKECSIRDWPDYAVVSPNIGEINATYTSEVDCPRFVVNIHQEEDDPSLVIDKIIYDVIVLNDLRHIPEGSPGFSVKESSLLKHNESRQGRLTLTTTLSDTCQ
jgi:hypothetical protein